MDQFVPVYLKLPPEHIAFLTDIIESYEGIGVVRTLNPATGYIVVLALSDTVQTIKELVAALQQQLNAKFVEPPDSVNGDWLLATMADPSEEQ